MADREAVECLYCGAEMNPDRTFKSMLPPGVDVTFWYLCGECCATSPRCETRELAYAAARTRYREKNRVLTLEEVDALEKPVAIWIEDKYLDEAFIVLRIIEKSDSKYVRFNDGYTPWKGYYLARYRAWLRRPTDEERERIAWN